MLLMLAKLSLKILPNFLDRYIIYFVIIIVLQYKLWFGDANIFNYWQLQHQIIHLSKQNINLQIVNHNLLFEMQQFKKETHKIVENIARYQLGLIKDKETLYLFTKEK